jgi:hypothetical protein
MNRGKAGFLAIVVLKMARPPSAHNKTKGETSVRSRFFLVVIVFSKQRIETRLLGEDGFLS